MKDIGRRLSKIEKQLNVGLSGSDDPRVYYYPTTYAEVVHMASMSQDKLQEHLRTRRNRPSSQVCDLFDRLLSQQNE